MTVFTDIFNQTFGFYHFEDILPDFTLIHWALRAKWDMIYRQTMDESDRPKRKYTATSTNLETRHSVFWGQHSYNPHELMPHIPKFWRVLCVGRSDQRSFVVETTYLDEAGDEIVAVNGFSANAALNWSFLWFLLKNKRFSWCSKWGLIQGQEIKTSWDNNKRLRLRLRRADCFGHSHLYISDSSLSSSPFLWNKLWSKIFDW